MFGQIEFLGRQRDRDTLAKAGHAPIDPIRRTLILVRKGVAAVSLLVFAVSLLIFGVVGLLADDSRILVYGLIPIIAFNWVMRDPPGSDSR